MEWLEPRRLLTLHPLSAYPALHSDPGATAVLFLNFIGNLTQNWGYNSATNAPFHPNVTPAFDTDGDPNTFSDAELSQIQEIWARVAEKYSPFNVDVTTVGPGNFGANYTVEIVIGGTMSWYTGAPAVSQVGGYNSGYTPDHIGFDSPSKYSNNIKWIAEGAAHEAGHEWGLQHQGAAGPPVVEYYAGSGGPTNNGTGADSVAPIMGVSYYAERGLWWRGTQTSVDGSGNAITTGATQDDLDVLSNVLGYRADDHPDYFTAGDPLQQSGGQYSGSGIIERNGDADWFSFTTAIGGTVRFTVSTPVGGMLAPRVELAYAVPLIGYGVLADQTASGASPVTVQADLTAGTYFLFVGASGYGNLGQYSISGVNFVPQFTVVNTNDSGAGSLRQAILDVNNAGAGKTIQFHILTSDPGYSNSPFTGTNTWTILPLSPLPAITSPLTTIDGFSETRYAGNQNILGPEIEIAGNFAGSGANGLVITSNFVTVQGLVIRNFQQSGIWIHNASFAIVSGCFLGTDFEGRAASGNALDGIAISTGSTDDTIGGTVPGYGAAAGEGNVCSGNGLAGIGLFDNGTSNNTVEGNIIGLTRDADTALGNSHEGILLSNANNNTIGGSSYAAANIVCSNGYAGISIVGTTAQGNDIAGNLVGVNSLGQALGNHFEGVYVDASANIIEANTLAANGFSGVSLVDSANVGNNGNSILSNWIGVAITASGGDYAAWEARGNSHEGIYITTHGNTVQNNLVSANATAGISLSGINASNNNIYGNYVGTDVSGTEALGNGGDGVYLHNASFNNIGGASPGQGNVICSNAYAGISINDGSAEHVVGNLVGVNSLNAPLGNHHEGIYVDSSLNTISNNTIAANAFSGIALVDPGAVGNFGNIVASNDVGVVVSGNTTTSMGNSREGIYITSVNNTLHDNVISGNGISGISLSGSMAHGNNIYANRIGTDASSTVAIPNPVGVWLNTGAHDNTIGSPGNFISGNAGDGVFIDFNGGISPNNIISGNYIGLTQSGATIYSIPNARVGVDVKSPSNTISANVISANGGDGVDLDGIYSYSNVVRGNYIGTDPTGNAARGNYGIGVVIADGAYFNTIGGSTTGAGNVVSANGNIGIADVNIITNYGNTIQGNTVGLGVDGTTPLGNAREGIFINADNDTIGGSIPGQGNLVSSNGYDGIRFTISDGSIGPEASSTTVQGNTVGWDAGRTLARPNGHNGIRVDASSYNGTKTILIGGTNATALNYIGNNTLDGIQINAGAAANIRGNIISSNGGLGINLAPDGIYNVVTPNDVGDADGLQNYPVLQSATATSITGTLNSLPNTTFNVDFYDNVAGDPSGHGEGNVYLGNTSFSTNGFGNGSFSFSIANPPGSLLTATVSGPIGTSEFALNLATRGALGTGSLLEGPAAGTDSDVVVFARAWTATANASWLHTSSAGTGNGLAVFTFDANPGLTRSGTLTIGGETLTVTQAGSSYVAASPLTTLVSSGLAHPNDVAVDAAGNVYVADAINNAIKEWHAATQTVSTLVSSGLNGPQSLAVDAEGNVYFADTYNNAIDEWHVASDSVTPLVSSGLNNPYGVAVDAARNVYIADTYNSAIKEWHAATGAVSTLVSSGLNQPYGVAVDAAGNVYIADTYHAAIKEWQAATQTVSTLVSSGLNGPYGLAVDGAGNVYIADSGNNVIKEWHAATQTASTPISAGLNSPDGVVMDAAGNIFIADSGNNAIKELPRAFVPAGTVNETAAAGSDVLPSVLPTSELLAGPFAPSSDQSWLTIGNVSGGAVNFTFTDNGTGMPHAAHLTVLGQQVTVTQAAPLAAGSLVEGPAAGTDSDIVSVSLGFNWNATSNASWLHTSSSGKGNGLAVFTFDANPGVTRSGTLTIAGETLTVTQAGSSYLAANPLTTLPPSGLSNPSDVAVDVAGNVYIADTGNNAIKEWHAATNTVTTLVSAGLNSPYCLAVDGAGNVYIADTGNNAVKEWIAATNSVTTLVSAGLNGPLGLAVDVSGNVYIIDAGISAVKEWHAATGTVSTLVSSPLNIPFGVAVDGAGNVYIGDTYDNAIKEWNVGTQTLSTLVSSGLNQPYGVAVDGAGNVYFADTFNNAIKEWHAATNTVSSLASTGLNQPYGVAVDGAGNVYIADTGNSAIKEVPRAFVPGGAINETAVAGSDVLLPVLPTNELLTAVFAPSSDVPWLTVNSVSGGAINFSFTQNPGPARTAHITVLGQLITVTQAATQVGKVIWTGGGSPNTAWTDADNWGHTTVVDGDSLRFAGVKGLTNTNDFPVGTEFNGISFDPSAGAFTLNGNEINLDGNIVNNSSKTQTINLPFALVANQTLNAATGNLIIGGSISNNAGDQYGIVVVGPGSVTLTGVNTYAGRTTVSSGTLIVTSSTALPDGADLAIGFSSIPGFSSPIPSTAIAAASTVASASSAGPETGTKSGTSGGPARLTSAAIKPNPVTSTEAVWRQVHRRQTVNALIAQRYATDAARLAAAVSSWPGNQVQNKNPSIRALDALLAQYGR
jgi:autotransporter-associated beta strand protein